MLPSWMDLAAMRIYMWITIVVGIIVIIQTIRHVEKAMLRVFITVLIGILCISCYFYQKNLTECKNTGKQCTFLGYTVPATGSIFSK